MSKSSVIKKPDEGKVIFEAIPVNEIVVSNLNSRKVKPGDPGIKQLAESLKTTGQLVPVVVRQVREGYELLAGQRRLVAAKSLGWEEIKAEIVEANDDKASIIITTENLQRENLTPFEEAEQLSDLMGRFDNDARAVAAELGRSANWVARRSRLLKLSPKWKELLKQTDEYSFWTSFTAGHLELIARYDEERQDQLIDELENHYIYDEISIDELERFLAESMMLLKKAPFKTDDETLIPEVGACTSCPKRTSCQSLLFEPEEISADQIEKNDKCLDEACWDKKVRIHVDNQIEKKKAEYPDLVKIVESGERFNDKSVLQSWEYSTCKKSDPEAVPAVVVEGKGAGKLRWIKPHGQLKKSQKVNPDEKKPLAERSENELEREIDDKMRRLEARRAAWLIRHIQEMFNSEMLTTPQVYGLREKDDLSRMLTELKDDGQVAFPRSIFNPTSDPDPWAKIISIAIAFGTTKNCEYSDDNTWIYLKKLYELKDSKTRILELWKNVAPVICNRLNFSTAESALELMYEARMICELLGVDFKELEEKAEQEIPMTKTLQNLIRAKEEKESGKKSSSKKAEQKKPAKKKQSKKKNPDILAPLYISDTLKPIVGEGPYTRKEITKRLWEYIKKNKLQDKQELTLILCDENLKAVCGGKSEIGMFEMTKHVSKHVSETVHTETESGIQQKTKKKSAKSSRKLKDIANDLESALADLELRTGERFTGTAAFVSGRKIKAVYHDSAPDGYEMLTGPQAMDYIEWLEEGNVGKFSEMD